MSSNIEIIKKCKWCGKEFVARKTTTEYCSHRCSGLAYKERKRQAKLSEFKAEYSTQIEGKIEIEKLEFLSPTQVCRLLGVSRATAYRYFADNAIATVQFKGKTLVRRQDIDQLFEKGHKYLKREKPVRSLMGLGLEFTLVRSLVGLGLGLDRRLPLASLMGRRTSASRRSPRLGFKADASRIQRRTRQRYSEPPSRLRHHPSGQSEPSDLVGSIVGSKQPSRLPSRQRLASRFDLPSFGHVAPRLVRHLPSRFIRQQ